MAPTEEVSGGGYAVVKKLGKGSFGTVYLVRNKKTGVVCCLKKMSMKAMTDQERTRALQEAQLLSQLNHPNIVAYVDSFVAKSKLHLFMQYCEGGDLDARLAKIKAAGETVPEPLVLDWASQMAFALSYCATQPSAASPLCCSISSVAPEMLAHEQPRRAFSSCFPELSRLFPTPSLMSPLPLFSPFASRSPSSVHDKKVLHRDLKSANVFLTGSGVVKLGDFGVSRVLSATQELASTFVGTPYYLSPELLENKPYNSSSDVWAYGCIVYEMCTFAHPFEAVDFPSLAVRILNAEPPELPQPLYSKELSALVAGMLRKNPAKRTTLKEVLSSPIVRARMARFVEEFVAPAPAAPAAQGGAAAAPAPTLQSGAPPGGAKKRSGSAVNGKQPVAPAELATAAPQAAAAQAVLAEPRAATGLRVAAGAGSGVLRPHSGSKRAAAGRPTSASAQAQAEESEGARREAEADILQEIALEKRRLQEQMAALEAEQARVAAQQQQSSSLRAFQKLLEHTDEPGTGSAAAVAGGGARTGAFGNSCGAGGEASAAAERWPLPGEPGWKAPPIATALTGTLPVQPPKPGGAPAPVAVSPGANALDRTLSAPTSPSVLPTAAKGMPNPARGDGSRARTDIPREGTLELGGAGGPPSALAATLDAGELLGLATSDAASGALPASTRIADGGGSFEGVPTVAEPRTRTIDEWAQCYAPKEDGKGLRRQPIGRLSSMGDRASSEHGADSPPASPTKGSPARGNGGFSGHASPHPPAADRQQSADEQRYESDFEQYESHDELALSLSRGQSTEGSAPRAAPAAGSAAEGGRGGILQLEQQLRELRTQTAHSSAKQQDLKHGIANRR